MAAVGQSFLQASFTWSSILGFGVEKMKGPRNTTRRRHDGGPRVHGYTCSLFPAEVEGELPFLGLVIMAAAYCVGVMIPSP